MKTQPKSKEWNQYESILTKSGEIKIKMKTTKLLSWNAMREKQAKEKEKKMWN